MYSRMVGKKYRIDSLYRDNEYSKVYRGWDEDNKRPVAIKQLKIEALPKDEASNVIKIFIEQIKKIKEANLSVFPQYYDLITVKGQCYLIMEWVNGKDLKILMKEQEKLDQEAALWYMEKIASTIVCLQNIDEPLILKDLKPSDIIGNDLGQIKILDFGTNEISSTIKGRVPGALIYSPYSAPEINVKSDEGDFSIDVYSLGAIIYQLLTGQEPGQFGGDFPSPSKYNHELRGKFCQLILDCLKSKDKRIPNMESLLKRIKKANEDEIENKEKKKNIPNPLESPIFGTIIFIISIILSGVSGFLYLKEVSPFIGSIVGVIAIPYMVTYIIYSMGCFIKSKFTGIKQKMSPAKLFGISGGFTFLSLLVFGVYAFSASSVREAKAYALLIGCENNGKTISVALESYAKDHPKKGYPKSLEELVPDYIKKIPHCPVARKDTYSSSYHLSKKYRGYLFYCKGGNHRVATKIKGNWPQFSSRGVFSNPDDMDIFKTGQIKKKKIKKITPKKKKKIIQK